MKNLNIQKVKSDSNDFKQERWHDNKIYALSFSGKEYELAFDIDHILEWIRPESDDIHFKFLVTPATLIFKNVYNLKLDLPSIDDVIIDSVYMENPATVKNSSFIGLRTEYDWTIETNSGEITFTSIGFVQHIREKGRLLDKQFIGIKERGGVSFYFPNEDQ